MRQIRNVYSYNKVRYLMLVCALPFITTNCIQVDDQPKYLGKYTLGDMEEYIKFEPFSYWVYENDNTSELDTLVMLYYHSNINRYEGKRNIFLREDITFAWRGNSGTYQFESLHPFVDLSPKPKPEVFNFQCSRFGDTSGLLYFPFSLPEVGGTSGQTTYLNQVHDSLKVGNIWFKDVAEFEIDRDWMWDGENAKYYWAKNVGLIKKEKYKRLDQVYVEGWYLIEYQIIK